MNGRELRVDDLAVGHGGPLVLDGLDLRVPAGTTLAILGESGSGKSTLLRAIAGLLRPARGRVVLGEVDVTDLAPDRRKVGMVFQSLALFPHADVAANVGFGPRTAGVSRAATRAVTTSWLSRVGLDGLGARDVSNLSGGQRQRVALARALAAEPDALLLDEPLGALDTGLRAELLAELREVFTETGTTVVHVTHDPTEAATLAHAIGVLDRGRLVQVGSPTELWESPANATVARLVGHPNVLPGPEPGTATVVPPHAVLLGDGPGALGATVVLVTPGAAWQVTVRTDDGRRLLAVTSAHAAPRTGERVSVRIDLSQALSVPESRSVRPDGAVVTTPDGGSLSGFDW